MENTLSLSVEEQNYFNVSLLSQVFSDNKHYAEESDENIADYFIRNFDANPEGLDFAFEYSYDEVSGKAKEQRKSILVNCLVLEGFVPTQEEI